MKTEEILHPGFKLKEIKPEALRNVDLSSQLGMCRTSLWRFMNGKRRLDPELAARLGKLHENTAYWLSLQYAWDLSQVGRREVAKHG
jgi:addiction module HigA family antidote